MSTRPRQMKPAMSAAEATRPQANSVAECGTCLEEKSVQFTVHDGRINPGNAAGGTSHCQCAFGDCSSRAEPSTRSRIASHAGADNPKPSATPKSIGKTDNVGGTLVSRLSRRSHIVLTDNHAIKSSNIKTV